MEATILTLSVLVLLFSVIVHEVMHGLAALYFGDHTAENAGRLTLNPLPHIDLIGTILLPLLLFISGSPVLFGWAKPVPVNPFNFSDIRKGELVVSSAGILANLFLAILAAIIFHLTLPFKDVLSASVLQFAVNINLVLAVFNLLPIPPLDGSKILMSFLPPKLAAAFAAWERYGIIILLLMWFIPFGNTTLLGLILGSVIAVFHQVLGV
ncbi:site-2 protease family protein [Patescibacteria group bacterium]|nr:site-2 protease family protein [Patescibacteria group bacterium]MCL5409449.1 site-2 protease family protein [Patescibacteria group bacterium]